MISKYTLRILKLMFWVASFIWISEIKWSQKKNKFIKKSTIRVPFMHGVQAFARYVAITYFGLFLLLSGNPILSWDFRIGFAMLFQCLVTTPVYIWSINQSSIAGLLCNQTLSVNRNMAKFHGRPTYVRRDGLEGFITLALTVGLILIPLAPFLMFLILQYRNPAIVRTIIHMTAFIFGTSVTKVNVGVSFVFAYFLAFDIALMMFYFVVGIAYINSASKWLQMHQWTQAIYHNRDKRQEMRLLFRQMQIAYKTGYEQFVRVSYLSISLIALTLYISFGLFFSIRSLDSSDHSIFAVQGLVTLIMIYGIKRILETLYDVTDSSSWYVTSLHTAIPHMMKYERCYVKSCRPFTWFVVELLVIDKQTFIWLMTKFIVDILLSLLQAFQ